MSADHWLDEVVREASAGRPLLVLCRTQATVRAVLRRLAESAAGARSGWPGLQVTTLAGLASQAVPGRLAPAAADDAALPASHPWKARLDDRPGLRRMLRARVAWLHEALLAGVSFDGLRPELRALVDAGYGRPATLEGARALLAHPPVERCLAVGFGPPDAPLGAVSPLDRALLRALRAQHVATGGPAPSLPSGIPALRLPDVAAEARAVAREALACGREARVLVLVADEASEERVSATLQRNGVAVADDGASPLSRHALIAALEPLVDVFGSRGDAPVDADDLVRLLTDAVLARTPVGDVTPVPGVESPRATTRHIRELLVAPRRARATTAEWVAILDAQDRELTREIANADEDSVAKLRWRVASARVLSSQLHALDAHARGRGRLADLHAFVSAIGLSDPGGDRLGQAILGALRTEGHRPATRENYEDALSGSISSGRVDAGVVTLPYAAYDGRDAGLVLLCDVHDKGLGHVAASDPLLTPGELAAAGLPSPHAAMRERLAIARWAASRARAALALVSATDASGRRVSPPVDLELTLTAREADASYGLAFDLPEARDRAALATGRGRADPLATQVDAEWARRGAAFERDAAGPQKDGDTLADQLPLELARIPDDLLPWLGAAGSHPANGDGLPPGFALSASRLEAFTHCLYRAFCDSVLRLEAPDDVSEDLDPREVGTAVHAALQKVLEGQKLLVPEKKLEATRAALLAALLAATNDAVKQAAKERPAGSDTELTRVARDGLRERWLNHWRAYLTERIQPVEKAHRSAQKNALAEVLKGELFTSAVDALAAGLTAAKPRKELLDALLDLLCEERGDPKRVLERTAELVSAVAGKNAPTVEKNLAKKTTVSALRNLCNEASAALHDAGFDLKGDLEIVAAEHPFGAMPREDGTKGPPLLLPLGGAAVPVRGQIDAVVRRRGPGDLPGTIYRVVDFKTGASGAKPAEITESLIRPQLPLYALALEAQGPVRRSHVAPARVEHGELDYVRKLERTGARLEEETLARIRVALGTLLDHAREGTWVAAPHPEGCPLLRERGVYCDHPDICRIRSKYEPADGEEAGA